MTLTLIWMFEFEALLASLLTSFVGFSIALLFTQGTLSIQSVTTPFDAIQAFDYSWLANGVPLHPAQIIVFLAILAFSKFTLDWFFDSEVGLGFRAMEDERSRNSVLPSIGISYWGTLGGGLISGNVLCAVSGVLVMLKEGQVTANRGFDALLAIITAYLFGTLLFERRVRRTDHGGGIGYALSSVAVFRPTSAAVLGALFYFALLTIVSRVDAPSSTPKLIMVALVLCVFVITRWPDIRARLATTTTIRPVAESAPFEATGVRVEYPGFPSPNVVLRNVRLRLEPGSAALLSGANGSGKSTLLLYLSGRISGFGDLTIPTRTTSGMIRRAQLVGYVSQEAQTGSVATLSVAENLSLFALNGFKSSLRRWRPLPEHVVPPPAQPLLAAGSRPAGSLSGGQRQVLGIGALLVRRDCPQVILFDEPLTHLDEANALACVDLMEALVRHGRTILIVQHDIEIGMTYESSVARTRLAGLVSSTIELKELEVPVTS